MNFLEETRFSITRTVTADNVNTYSINDTKVPFKDVSKKLSDYGIDLRYNRFLILQGEVEQISLMKPKAPPNQPNAYGMLEYLEDIIGSSRFKEPLAKLDIQIEKFSEEMTTASECAKIAFKDLANSKEAKMEAVNALKLENDIKRKRGHILMFDMHTMQEKLKDLEEDFSEIEAVLKEHTDKAAELEAEKEKLDSECKEKGGEHDRLQKLQTETKAKLDEFTAKDYFIHQKTTELTKKVKKLGKSLDEQKRKLEALQADAQPEEEVNAAIDEIEQRREKLEQKLKKLEEQNKAEMEAAQADCADLIKQREALDKECVRLRDDQKEKLSRMNEAKNVLNVQRKSLEAAETKLQAVVDKITKAGQDVGEKEMLIERYSTEIPAETKKLEKLKKTLEAEDRQYEIMSSQLNAAKAEMSSTRQSMEQSHSRDHVRNALMGAVAEGKLQGLYGQLRDLGAIDGKYDKAISTACGRLYNYVTDTLDNAQRAVEYMKEHNLPTVTFIALDKLRVRWEENVRYDEGVPRLFDLVRIKEERFKTAFYFSLGETVVANDLDQATRLGYGRNRLRTVTLDGAIIEPDGSMTGGGKPRSGGMSDRIQADDGKQQARMDELKKKVAELQEQVAQLSTKIDSLNREINTCENDIATMTERQKKFTLEVNNHRDRMKQMEKAKKEAEMELQNVKANSQIEAAQREYDEAEQILKVEQDKSNEKQDALSDVEKQIEKRLAGRLDPIKKEKKEVEKKLKEVQAERTKLLSNRKATELSITKLTDSIAADESTREEAQKELEDFKKQREELEAATKQLNADFLEAQSNATNFQDEYAELQKRSAKVSERLKKLKSERIDVENEYNKKAKVVNEQRAIVEGLRRELLAIKLEPLGEEHAEESMPMHPTVLISKIERFADDHGKAPEPGQFYKFDAEKNNASLKRILSQHSQQPPQPPRKKPKQQQPPTRQRSRPQTHEGDESMEVDEDSEGTEPEDEPMEHDGDDDAVEMLSPFQVPPLSEQELEEFQRDAAVKELKNLEEELKKLSPNFTSIEKYLRGRAAYAEKFEILDAIVCKREVYKQLRKTTWDKRRNEFRVDFDHICKNLKTLYQKLSLGGDARLEYINTLDPFSMGINFAVRPNKKAWKVNTSLSGGEKTLASLALIFALHYYKPSPLYIMDEIDAALDFKNVSIIAHYVTRRVNTQFLIISLRANMFDLSHRMIGIYKTNNITHSITFDPRVYNEIAKNERDKENIPSQANRNPAPRQLNGD